MGVRRRYDGVGCCCVRDAAPPRRLRPDAGLENAISVVGIRRVAGRVGREGGKEMPSPSSLPLPHGDIPGRARETTTLFAEQAKKALAVNTG